MRSAATPLLRQLRRAFALSLPAEALEGRTSRREFLTKTAAATLAVSSLGLAGCASNAAASKKRKIEVGILGAGIAGLHAAYVLKKAGIQAQVFDSSERTGGRMFSKDNLLAEGLVTELGGEFIDSNHEDMLALAKEFKLPLLDMKSDAKVDEYDFYFRDNHYTVTDFVKALKPYSKAILADIEALPDTITYQNPGSAKTWDKMSITQYLKSKGLKGWIFELLDVAFTTEYGLDSSEQSAVNFLFLFDPALPVDEFELFGESDERFKIEGGNQRLVDELAKRIPDIRLSWEVEKISTAGPGVRVLFRSGDDIYFDYLICTIPFSRLRHVTLDIADLPAVKRRAINELGYGTNAKFLLGFTKRLWRELGFSGQVFADNGIQLAWDNSRLQPGKAGGLTVYTGGTNSASMIKNPKPVQAEIYLKKLNKIYPSLQQFYNGNHGLFYWPDHPHTLGSYACYKVGQWSAFAGAEIEPVGALHFAGEHCSADFQGYMNGGAETGRRAAESVLKAMK